MPSQNLVRSLFVSLSLLLLLASAAGGQLRDLTLDDLYSPDPDRRLSLSTSLPRISWLDDRSYLLQEEREDEQLFLRVDAESGSEKPFYDRETMQKAMAEIPGMTSTDAERLSGRLHQRSPSDDAVLINHQSDLFYYRYGSEQALRLTFDPESEMGEEISPDGRFVSFVRNNDMFLIELASGRERQLTNGGGPELFFGRLDWVYQEEVYGRGNFKGYWWSPDSKAIAFLRLDESPVREFTVVDHLPTELETEVTNYPKAGSPNPKVTLGVVDALGGRPRWIDTSRYEPIEHLIVRVGWSPDSSKVIFQVQDREQRWLDLNAGDRQKGTATTLFRETTPAFVNVTGEPVWLDDGSFLWLSERTGYQHIYRFNDKGTLVQQITDGEWEVRSLHGVDAANERIYYSGMELDPIAPQVYRIGLDGKNKERLSEKAGSHRASFSEDFSYFTDSWSDVTTPTQLRLYRGNGDEVRALATDLPEAISQIRWGSVERLQVPTRDGFQMEAMVIKPPDFDASKKYPVLQYNYGGPHAPVVRDAWGGSRYLWHQLLAQKGYVIWMCDNRSASGKGIKPTWEAYQRMGEVELRDIEDGLVFLKKQRWVDPDRIGIWGWSYGGFMASYALTHSKSFKAGIAGAPVTDWRLYDTIYTERYMRMPQNNPEGYETTSVVNSAADLHGTLMIIHGTMDDNVHFQNTVQFVYELQKAGKDFELMFYPKSRHGVRDRELSYHLQREMTEFILENL